MQAINFHTGRMEHIESVRQKLMLLLTIDELNLIPSIVPWQRHKPRSSDATVQSMKTGQSRH